MKLSISLPDKMAREIRALSKNSQRSISWWIQMAWTTARTQMQNPKGAQKKADDALAKLMALEGVLRDSHNGVTSVELAHSAFKKKD